jgi:hypothetical protein
MSARSSVLLLAAFAGYAHAEDEVAPTPAAPTPVEQEPPAPAPIDWNSAPRPDAASGIESHDAPTETPAHKLSRAILFVPRWLVWGVAQPVRAGAYAYDRYQLPSVYDRTFYSSDRKFGVYPTATYDSGYGFTGGVRVVHHDVLGASERVKLRANFGGRYWFAYGINMDSGARLGDRVTLELDFSHERRPNERFFGIGNIEPLPAFPEMPIDPNAAAVDTRLREDMARGMVRTDVVLGGNVTARFSGALTSRSTQGTGESDSIDHAYMTDRLVGWEGVQHFRGEGELVYDTRRPTSSYVSSAIDATGWYASVHGGATRGIGDDSSQFESYGGEVQRYFDLYHGSRVLAVRALVETVVSGPVSFLDLPRLGGTDFLRGYAGSRFRDRTAALTTAEYTWDLGNFLAAYTFVDVGRVFPSISDINAEDLRVGYGGGLQFHTNRSYVGRIQLSGSKDEDMFFELVLSPAFPRRERVGRM